MMQREKQARLDAAPPNKYIISVVLLKTRKLALIYGLHSMEYKFGNIVFTTNF